MHLGQIVLFKYLYVFLAIFDQTSAKSINTLNIEETKEKIIGGRTVTDFENVSYVAQVICDHKGVHTYCTGVIISELHILTAAHCVSILGKTEPNKCETVYVYVGSSKNMDGKKISVSRIHYKPTYNVYDRIPIDDISVLTLESPIETTEDNYRVISLPKQKAQIGLDAKFIGLGVISPDFPNFCVENVVIDARGLRKNVRACSTIQEITLATTSESECYGHEMYLPYDQLCVRDRNAVATLGMGDSGGPLIVDDTVIGILSSCFLNYQPEKPSAFTDVFYHKKYISSIVSREMRQFNKCKKQ